mmetsp:Transcript_4426/g.9722  ORF Transcript_4426/g.9722 Transcript_4426/m.9722 type:complete len:361 (+) Transcript_4426:240-1322(+)
MQVVPRLIDEVVKRWPWTPASKVTLLAIEYDTGDEEQNKKFLEDIRSRVQLVYRCNIPQPLKADDNGKELYTDKGWGCALRVMQMMLAQGFVSFRLGREWRFDAEKDLKPGSEYMDIVSCFLDEPSAPFSLHRFVGEGWRLLRKAPSVWFGPTSGARVAADLFRQAQEPDTAVQAPHFLKRLACVTFEDGVVYKEKVQLHFDAGASGVLFFVCRRLGVEKFNFAEYQKGVQGCFSLPQFQGLASGNNSTSAHFFVATSDDRLVFLDPHITLPALSTLEQIPGMPESGLQARGPLYLRWGSLNPSVCMGFLVHSSEEFLELCATLSQGDMGQVFEVLERAPVYVARTEETYDEDDDIVVLQ